MEIMGSQFIPWLEVTIWIIGESLAKHYTNLLRIWPLVHKLSVVEVIHGLWSMPILPEHFVRAERLDPKSAAFYVCLRDGWIHYRESSATNLRRSRFIDSGLDVNIVPQQLVSNMAEKYLFHSELKYMATVISIDSR